jgi:LacI family transcriptional regulator
MATIYEVAAKAGVSAATVSRVFNGLSVSPTRSSAVRAAAEELSFIPSRTARSLRTQSSEVIALVIPDIENPFFTSLARGVEDSLHEAGFSVVLCNTDDDTAREAKYFDIAVSENMAGVIVAPASEHTNLKPLLERRRPVVAVDRSTAYPIDGAMVDDFAAGQAATKALSDAGYRRIACVTGQHGIQTAEERSRGWRRVASQRANFDTERYLEYANFRVDGGRGAMAALLAMQEPPDAVVAANNLMGVGVLQVLSEQGLSPPTFGVAVVGDLPYTTIAPSAITVVHIPARQLGMTAAAMLLDRIAGDAQPVRTIVLRNEVTPANRLFRRE